MSECKRLVFPLLRSRRSVGALEAWLQHCGRVKGAVEARRTRAEVAGVVARLVDEESAREVAVGLLGNPYGPGPVLVVVVEVVVVGDTRLVGHLMGFFCLGLPYAVLVVVVYRAERKLVAGELDVTTSGSSILVAEAIAHDGGIAIESSLQVTSRAHMKPAVQIILQPARSFSWGIVSMSLLLFPSTRGQTHLEETLVEWAEAAESDREPFPPYTRGQRACWRS